MINEISFLLVLYWFHIISLIFYLRVTDSEMDGQKVPSLLQRCVGAPEKKKTLKRGNSVAKFKLAFGLSFCGGFLLVVDVPRSLFPMVKVKRRLSPRK